MLPVNAMEPASRWPRAEAEARESDRRDLIVSEYLRQINWWFLVCFVLSSVWVSNGGTCVRFWFLSFSALGRGVCGTEGVAGKCLRASLSRLGGVCALLVAVL